MNRAKMVSDVGRILADLNADACGIDRDDNWKIYGDEFISDAGAALFEILEVIDAQQVEIQVLKNDLINALEMLAGWCVAVEAEPSWDSWDDCYKDAMYRDGPLRGQLDAIIATFKKENS